MTSVSDSEQNFRLGHYHCALKLLYTVIDSVGFYAERDIIDEERINVDDSFYLLRWCRCITESSTDADTGFDVNCENQLLRPIFADVVQAESCK